MLTQGRSRTLLWKLNQDDLIFPLCLLYNFTYVTFFSIFLNIWINMWLLKEKMRTLDIRSKGISILTNHYFLGNKMLFPYIHGMSSRQSVSWIETSSRGHPLPSFLYGVIETHTQCCGLCYMRVGFRESFWHQCFWWESHKIISPLTQEAEWGRCLHRIAHKTISLRTNQKPSFLENW